MFCPYEVRYLSFPMSLTSSGWSPWRPRSNRACSPASRMISSTSFVTLSTVSSVRAGWMRPSWTRRVRAILATSRRTGLNPDRMTASGVSSMMTSIPVAASNARMLRPSLPMIGLCLLGRPSPDPLEVLPRPADHLLELRVPPFEIVLQLGDLPLLFPELLRPGLEGLRLPVERVLLLEEAFLELADLVR